MSAGTDIVKAAGDLAAQAYNTLVNAQTVYDNDTVSVASLRSQLAYHQGVVDPADGVMHSSHPGVLDQPNANIVNAQLITALGKQQQDKITLDAAKADYDAKQADYTTKMNTLLSPEEKQGVVLAQQADNLAQQAANIQSQASLTAQGTTKYLIWGGVVLVIITVVVWVIWKKHKAA